MSDLNLFFARANSTSDRSVVIANNSETITSIIDTDAYGSVLHANPNKLIHRKKIDQKEKEKNKQSIKPYVFKREKKAL